MEGKKHKSGKMKWVGKAVAAAALGTAAAVALSDKKTRDKVKGKASELFDLAREKVQQMADEVVAKSAELKEKKLVRKTGKKN